MSNTALARNQLGNISVAITGELLEVEGWTGLQIVRGIDQAADAFSFSFPWEATEENKRRFVAYRTSTVQIKYDNEVIVSGIAEKYEPTSSAEGVTMTLNGRSRSGALLELSAGPPFELAGTFNAIANQIIPTKASGGNRSFVTVRAVPDFLLSTGIVLNVEPGQTIWEVLSKIAAGRNLYAFPQPDGGIIFKTITVPSPSADIREGLSPVISVSTSMDLTQRFYEYIVSNTNGGDTLVYSEIDRGVAPDIRAKKYTQTDQPGEIENAAKFARNRGIMDSYTCTVTVAGWTTNDGTLWAPGMTVNVYYPSAMIYRDSLLMIKRVTMQLDENGGAVTQLELTFPQVFTGGDITRAFPYPWSLTP
jgi:prophage tail gpP-like protein